ncbi:hypothetical protein JCM19233_6464 [Vibrio astriarenae]|nr:hypothetical protein JCM19233_6464 [Vibrio sp. C7]
MAKQLKKQLLAAAISPLLLLSAQAVAADTDSDVDNEQVESMMQHGYYMLKGQFTYPEIDGETYTFSVPLDLLRPDRESVERRAVILPQEYKKFDGNSEQTFAKNARDINGNAFSDLGGGYKVTCDGLMGPGIRGWVGPNPVKVNCSYKAGNGSSADTGTINGLIVRSSADEQQAAEEMVMFKGVNANSKTLKVKDAAVNTELSTTLTLKVDELNYRTGSSHSVFLYPRRVVAALNEQLKDMGSKNRVRGCADKSSGDLRGVAGKSPKLECVVFYKERQLGAKAVESYGLITLE